ncbi:MAG TPA: acetate--CoA ligase family protein [Candidatus Limiplasma sp.]|nr:acetate--CoA ligase family protein [Candidatus Limiplasma sp.]HRX07647.1 acetate--CoA ligase family protein [Candidatus Limiplasma sp.]
MEQQILHQVNALLQTAHQDGRHTLYEHEVYELLRLIGFDIPLYRFVKTADLVNEALIAPFGGKDIMVKVVSRDLAHNQRYGGVKRVGISDPLFIRYVLSHMKKEVLSHFEDGQKPRIDGFLLIEFIHFTQAIGDEIMLGFQEDPSFGTVVTLTKGGDDAEFFAKYYDPANLLLAPISLADAQALLNRLNIRHKYSEMGQPQRLSEIAQGMARLSDLGLSYSMFTHPGPPFYFKALDLNPVVFSKDGRFVAVDGYAEFTPAGESCDESVTPNGQGLSRFFEPRGIVVTGVSTDPQKYSMARNIVTLLLDLGRTDIYCVNPKGGETVIGGHVFSLYTSIDEIREPYDLLVYAAPGKYSLSFVESVPSGKSVILISGIPADMDYRQFAAELARVRKPDVRVVGPNCMGVFSAPGGARQGVNTLFIEEDRLSIPLNGHANTALLTQSGAMSITFIERNQQTGIFRSIVSFGNKVDVNIPDLMAYCEADPLTDVIAIYVEGLGAGEGRQFYELLRKSSKPVIIYKSGRTEAGAKAAASHTAAMSGSYEVFRAACLQGGCILTEELDDFYNYTKTFAVLSRRPARGCRVAGVVNAGLEATMGADILNELTPATFSAETVETLKRLNTHGLVNVESPFLDLTPMTDDRLYVKFIEAALEDPNVDCLFVGIVPHVESLKTVEDNYLDADALGPLLVDAFRRTKKPVVVSVNAGRHYQALVHYLEENGLPVFSDIRSAIRSLDAFAAYWSRK